jgi:hypothetical protein
MTGTYSFKIKILNSYHHHHHHEHNNKIDKAAVFVGLTNK